MFVNVIPVTIKITLATKLGGIVMNKEAKIPEFSASHGASSGPRSPARRDDWCLHNKRPATPTLCSPGLTALADNGLAVLADNHWLRRCTKSRQQDPR